MTKVDWGNGPRWEVVKRDNLCCVYCGLDGRKSFAAWLQLIEAFDHLVPVSAGGADSMNNLVTSCWICNKYKGTWDLRRDDDPPITNDNRWRQEMVARVRQHLEKKCWDYYRPDYDLMKAELGGGVGLN